MNKKSLSNFGVKIGLLLFLLLLPLGNIYAIRISPNPLKGEGDIKINTIFIVTVIILWIIMPMLIKRIKRKFFKKIIVLITILFSLFLFIGSMMPFWFIGAIHDFREIVKCNIYEGEYFPREYSVDYVAECVLKANDYKKNCSDDIECEGYCMIENDVELKEAWDYYYPNHYDEYGGRYKYYNKIKINEWENITDVKIKGSCSEFKQAKGSMRNLLSEDSLRCGSIDRPAFVIRNGIIERSDECPIMNY